ncbi:MAG: hypothetical protein ACWA5Q_09020, partial [bacterium]
AQVDQHLRECQQCQQVLDDVGETRGCLQELPSLPAPDSVWTSIEQQVPRKSEKHRVLASLAMAATALLIAVVVVLKPGNAPVIEPLDQDLIGETQKLERTLSSMNNYAGPMDLATASRIAGYEDTIRLIDQRLSANGNSAKDEQLWRQRNRLLRGLVATRAQPVKANYLVY